jgi:hypothetical protein
MKPEKREKMTTALLAKIDAAMLTDADMRREAIVEGRIGLKEMSDEEFEDFALDSYNLDEQNNFCDQCGAASDDGEGENGLCGNCADKLYNDDGELIGEKK